MLRVVFHSLNSIPDHELAFAVIIARQGDRYVFVRHRQRSTYELPGGHREAGESIDQCAARELQEETAAVTFELRPLFIYEVKKEGSHDYGQVFLAEITARSNSLTHEIGDVVLLNQEQEPAAWTYPLIQPLIFRKYQQELC